MRSVPSLLALLALGAAAAAEPALPDVRDVAGDTLTVLYDGGDAVLLDFRFPPAISLPDHATGPRAVLVMSDGLIERTTGATAGQRTELRAGSALWLEGRRGNGFVNAGDGELRYLVFQPHGEAPLGQPCEPEVLIHGEGIVERLLDAPLAMIWRVTVRGEAWLQLGEGTRQGVAVLSDGRVPALRTGEVLHFTDGSALYFCNR